MGLTTSLSTALTGLKASQQSISVLAQNIANANNSKYSRQTVSQSAIVGGDIAGAGVRIDEVTRVVDGFINKTVTARSSLVARAEVIDSYYQQSQIIIGQPGRANSIDTYTQKFFESMHTLSTDSNNSSLKQTAVAAASTLALQIAALAQGMEDLRFQADGEIQTSVANVNNAINQIFDLNIAMGNAATLGQSSNTIADEIDAQLAILAEEINIQYTFNQYGQASVSTANGALLIDNANRYQLRYESAFSVQEFIDDSPRTPIEVLRADVNGKLDENSKFNLVSGGDRDDVISPLSGGKIQGLLEIRDTLMPQILDQLDNMAATLRDEVNKVYNNGTSYPPATSLTGTTLIDPTELASWSGSVLIGAVKTGNTASDGLPATSPYASENGLKPLVINFDKLTDQAGAAGTFKFQTIIDEINNYYGIPQNKTSIGDISNIELISKSDSLTAGTGSFNFSLETTNLSANTRNYTITNITTSDPNIVVTAPAAFPTSAFTSNAGATELASNTNFSLNMSSGLIGAGPYTIAVGISVADGNGGFFTDTINYVVSQNADGLINDRFAASSLSGAGNATIEAPTTNQPVLYATLVDENGVEIQKSPTTNEYLKSGYLKISGASGVGVGIAELTSQQLGTSSTDATNYAFSHYLGMNNFFETGDGTNPSQLADAAISMRVREDIVNAPGSISVGALRQSSQSTVVGAPPRYTYEISAGNNDTILNIDDLSSAPINFAAAGGISRTTVSFNNYAAQILGYSATVSNDAAEEFRKEDLIYQGFLEKQDSISGVNVDEEIANTITFQNAYTANARVISVINEMFDALLAAF